MLKPQALANSLAGATALLYLFLYVLKLLAPPFFELILNSQYLGADVASQLPQISFPGFLGALIAIAVTSWTFGYIVAVIYNKYEKRERSNG